MEFAEAAKMLEVKNPVGVDELGELLASHHADSPQTETMARMAVALVREGLAKLAALGHQFHLVEHDPSRAVLRFPQAVRKDGETKVVESEREYDAAAREGWR